MTENHDEWLAETTRLLDPDPDPGVLDDLHAALVRYVVLPSPEAADAVVLWIAATHAQPAWEHAPRLVLTSPEKRCGKSRCLDVVAETCRRPLITVNATVAAVVRSLGDDPPTLLVDEADTIFGTKRQADNNEELRGVLNAGHQRNRPMIRWNITTRSLESLPTFAMACLAAIGDLPATIMDRAAVVRMRRRAPGEPVAPYRSRRDSPGLKELRDRLADWVASVSVRLVDPVPDMPVEDRAADTWEPLVAVADAAGGDWPARARAAALVLVAEAETADFDMSRSVRLLADIRDLFTEFTVSFMPSAELLVALRKITDAPWSDDLTASGLATRLRGFGVRPRRNSAGTLRGYRLDDLDDAFRRYLPSPRQNPSDPSDTGLDLGRPSDGSGPSDGSTRQTVRRVEPVTSTSDALTGSDGPAVAAFAATPRGCEHNPCLACLDCWQSRPESQLPMEEP
jgi:hypothetical protein